MLHGSRSACSPPTLHPFLLAMSLNRFARTHGYDSRQVHRFASAALKMKLVLEGLDEGAPFSVELPRAGFRARLKPGSSRVSYTVTDEATLQAMIEEEMTPEPFSKADRAVLLGAAEAYATLLGQTEAEQGIRAPRGVVLWDGSQGAGGVLRLKPEDLEKQRKLAALVKRYGAR